MKTAEEIWKIIIQEKSALPGFPVWIREMSVFSVADMLRDKKFHIETKELDPSYLQFLEEQIILEPRGPEWTKILRKRVDVLRPFVGKSVINAMIKNENHLAFVKIDPEKRELISLEDCVL